MSRALLSAAVAAVCVPLVIACLALPWGCGAGVDPLTPQQRARLQCDEVANRLHMLRGKDGWHTRVADTGETDEDGNPLVVAYERRDDGTHWSEDIVVSIPARKPPVSARKSIVRRK